MKKLNGNPLVLEREEPWDGNADGREILNDSLAREVREACDRFFERRRMRKTFKDAWRAYQTFASNRQ
jgi:hypothetical protein